MKVTSMAVAPFLTAVVFVTAGIEPIHSRESRLQPQVRLFIIRYFLRRT